MFWFAAACSTPKPEVLMERQYAFVQSEKEQTLRYQELLRIDLKAEGYDEHPPLADRAIYYGYPILFLGGYAPISPLEEGIP